MADPGHIGRLAGTVGDVPDGWLETLLDAVPTPLLLVDPATAHVRFANAAAQALPDALDTLPLERAAAGERLREVEAGAYAVSAETVPAGAERAAVVLVAFEEVAA